MFKYFQQLMSLLITSGVSDGLGYDLISGTSLRTSRNFASRSEISYLLSSLPRSVQTVQTTNLQTGNSGELFTRVRTIKTRRSQFRDVTQSSSSVEFLVLFLV